MNIAFNNLLIAGIAVALPKNKLELSSLSLEFGDKEVKRIIASTGISSVRIANNNMNASDLCLAAANNLLEKSQVLASSIDAIVFVFANT